MGKPCSPQMTLPWHSGLWQSTIHCHGIIVWVQLWLFPYSDGSHTVDKQTVCWWELVLAMHGCSCWLSLHCLELQHRLSMRVQLPLSASEDSAASRCWVIHYHCIRVTSVLPGETLLLTALMMSHRSSSGSFYFALTDWIYIMWSKIIKDHDVR